MRLRSKESQDWESSSVVELVLSMYMVLGSDLGTTELIRTA